MTILGLDHVQLAMPPGRETEAIAFYQGLLGIPHIPKPEHLRARGGCWFERGQLRIHLGVEVDFTPARKAHPGLITDDLAELRLRLETVGHPVTADAEDATHGYVLDPFGNRIELIQQHG